MDEARNLEIQRIKRFIFARIKLVGIIKGVVFFVNDTLIRNDFMFSNGDVKKVLFIDASIMKTTRSDHVNESHYGGRAGKN